MLGGTPALAGEIDRANGSGGNGEAAGWVGWGRRLLLSPRAPVEQRGAQSGEPRRVPKGVKSWVTERHRQNARRQNMSSRGSAHVPSVLQFSRRGCRR